MMSKEKGWKTNGVGVNKPPSVASKKRKLLPHVPAKRSGKG